MNTPYRYDVELAPHADALPARDLRDLAAARVPRVAPSLDTPEDVEVEDVRIPRSDSAQALLLRVFRPRSARNARPAVVQLHAGGFVLGSMAQDHQRDVRLCRALDAVVVAIEYRLAPEHPYPAAVHDVIAGLTWVAGHADALGVDVDRIALHGRSAGAGLAAGAALLARDRGAPRPCFLYLGMPQLDDRLATRSMQHFDDTPMWTSGQARLSWQLYLGGLGADGYAAPARAADLRDLPAIYLSAMEFDPLRDEAIAFSAALLDAGVPTELHVFPGTFHGSAGAVPGAEVSRREVAEEIEVLRRGLMQTR